MGLFRAPSAPPPMPSADATAAKSAEVNRRTAITQQEMNMVDQETPYGSLTYDQIGVTPDGSPRWRARTSLTPDAQARLDQQNLLDRNANQIAIDQLGRVSQTLSTPFKIDNAGTEARLMELGRARLDPMFSERRSALDTEMVNRGIRPGTEAYARSMGSFEQGRNDAYNQLLLNGRQQAVAEAIMERNQPLRETAALMGMGQLENPQFANTPQTGVQGVDYGGLVAANARDANERYRTDMGRHNAMMGGLFGLGGAALRAGMGGFGGGGGGLSTGPSLY